MSNLPDWLIICVWRALLGEIYPNIRAIALKYSQDSKYLLIRYYLDREPLEEDYESISSVETEMFSAVGNDFISHSDLECIHEIEIIANLDRLDGFVYVRKEY
ncbi:hypothetical protein KIMH_06250 [Bombiscardovia apis]|uniref:Colicin n=1 Tax=Bombiscardovia apis TaxID=2932182 RepID=A0ABN6SES5_9BIFI|nr:hypothetical protein [Bombiscardovia apis]BDR54514.1 hypothetical protein KIMH_06250 [Bombiscardovia apis]